MIFYPGPYSYSDADDIMTLSFDVGDELLVTTLRCCHLYFVFMAGFKRDSKDEDQLLKIHCCNFNYRNWPKILVTFFGVFDKINLLRNHQKLAFLVVILVSVDYGLKIEMLHKLYFIVVYDHS